MANLTTTEKIRLIAQRNNLTLGALAERSGQTRQNLSNKLGRGDFKESELRNIAEVLGCELKINFIDKKTGEEI